MDELYKTYGDLMIQAEILQAKIIDVKRKIASGLGLPMAKPEVKEKEKE